MGKIEQSIIESATDKLRELESIAIEPINNESTHQVLSLFFGIAALTKLAHLDSGLSHPTNAALRAIEGKRPTIPPCWA